MHYRIELSTSRRGAARVHLPGRTLDLDASRAGSAGWNVTIADSGEMTFGTVSVPGATVNDAVWRVARAAVRAFAELTGGRLDDEPPETAP